MTESDFQFVADLLKRRSGLVLGSDKKYLLESRLAPVAKKHGLSSLAEVVAALRKNTNQSLLRDVTEAMTTNESFFFRDTKPFEQFRTFVLPALLEGRAAQRRLRIWSAACSSGQEPYSLAMTLKEEQAKLQGWQVEIVATDLSNEVLDKAREGLYTQFEVQRGLPITQLMKYFKQEGERWRIDRSLRDMVSFREHNLLDGVQRLGRFDIVFLRNVLIYFDQATKTQVLDQVAGALAGDGYLFLGGAETVLGITEKFRVVSDQRGVYAPTRDAPATAAAAG